MILPAMGITSEMLAVFARKPIFGYRAMVYSMMGIAGLGFIVWGHHMFQSGMNPILGTTFMISTMVIAVPSAIKMFNWLGTLWGGDIHFTTPMLNALAFVSMFVIGGLSGHLHGLDPGRHLHPRHVLHRGAHPLRALRRLALRRLRRHLLLVPEDVRPDDERDVGQVHWAITFVAFNVVFFPMHFLGMRGMQRRIYDYTQYTHLKGLQPVNQFMTISLFVLGAAQIILILNFFLSMRRGKVAGPNPWHANTLEWQTSSPPPHENFHEIPSSIADPTSTPSRALPRPLAAGRAADRRAARRSASESDISRD